MCFVFWVWVWVVVAEEEDEDEHYGRVELDANAAGWKALSSWMQNRWWWRWVWEWQWLVVGVVVTKEHGIGIETITSFHRRFGDGKVLAAEDWDRSMMGSGMGRCYPLGRGDAACERRSVGDSVCESFSTFKSGVWSETLYPCLCLFGFEFALRSICGRRWELRVFETDMNEA